RRVSVLLAPDATGYQCEAGAEQEKARRFGNTRFANPTTGTSTIDRARFSHTPNQQQRPRVLGAAVLIVFKGTTVRVVSLLGVSAAAWIDPNERVDVAGPRGVLVGMKEKDV